VAGLAARGGDGHTQQRAAEAAAETPATAALELEMDGERMLDLVAAGTELSGGGRSRRRRRGIPRRDHGRESSSVQRVSCPAVVLSFDQNQISTYP
jgi:hypothetical protein